MRTTPSLRTQTGVFPQKGPNRRGHIFHTKKPKPPPQYIYPPASQNAAQFGTFLHFSEKDIFAL